MMKFTRKHLDLIIPLLKEIDKTKKKPEGYDEELFEIAFPLCGPHSWYCLQTDAYRFEWRVKRDGYEVLQNQEKYIQGDEAATPRNFDLAYAYCSGLKRAAQIVRESKKTDIAIKAIEEELQKNNPN